MCCNARKWAYLLVIVCVLVFAVGMCSKVYAAQTDDTQSTETTEITDNTETPDSTEATEDTEEAVSLKTPTLKVKSYTSKKVQLTWKKISGASKYCIYRSKSKDSGYKLIKSTKKLEYIDKSVKASTTYYYKIKAEGTDAKSKLSEAITVKTKAKVKKTAYIGDSVMSGLSAYKVVSGSGKKVITKIGVSVKNFYNGSLMDQLLDYNPDRLYIMIGMNCLYGSTDVQVTYYGKIIKECLKQNSDMQIVVLPVSPVRPNATVKKASINKFNSKIKKLAKKLKVNYYDYTGAFKDSSGNLKSSLSAGDGIHWTKSAYQMFRKNLDTYGKTLD